MLSIGHEVEHCAADTRWRPRGCIQSDLPMCLQSRSSWRKMYVSALECIRSIRIETPSRRNFQRRKPLRNSFIVDFELWHSRRSRQVLAHPLSDCHQFARYQRSDRRGSIRVAHTLPKHFARHAPPPIPCRDWLLTAFSRTIGGLARRVELLPPQR